MIMGWENNGDYNTEKREAEVTEMIDIEEGKK